MNKPDKLKKQNKNKANDSLGIKTEVRHLGVMIESVNDGVKLIAEQHGSIIEKLDQHTTMIGAIAVDMAIVKQDVEFIKSSMKKKIDIDEFSMLERRVALLEKHR